MTSNKNIFKPNLRRLFSYSNCGNLIRLVGGSGVKNNVGAVAGSIRGKEGRIGVWIQGKQYLLHRLIWIWHYGDIPDKLEVDHYNRDKTDNRIENLRLVTRSVNQHNTGKGVRFRPKNTLNPFEAHIKLDGKTKSAYFKTEEETIQQRSTWLKEVNDG